MPKAFSLRQFSQLWRALFRVTICVGMGETFYRLSARICAWLCGVSWFQQRFFQTEVDLIHQFLETANLRDVAPDIVIRRVLMSAAWQHLGFLDILLQISPSGFPLHRIVCTHGLHHFSVAREHHSGILCVLVHCPFGTMIEPYLLQQGISPVSAVRAFSGPVANPDPFIYGRMLVQAKRVLKAQGVVYMAPDGYFGGQGLSVSFFGRQRCFRYGMAELAIQTGATVLPAVIDLDMRGTLHVSFHSQLTPPAESGRTAMRDLTEQYIAFLSDTWRSRPSTPQLMQMRLHLAAPFTNPSVATEQPG